MHYKTISEISDDIQTKKISPVELTKYMLDRVEAHDGEAKSYVVVTSEYALSQAQVAEKEIMRGHWRGPLHGVPIGIKDLVYTKFAKTTGGTLINKDFTPSFNATVVDRLEEAGSIVLGKLKTTEQAFTDHHPSVTRPVNPWNAERWSGVSSSGSGVATAKGLAFATLGSDTGGSIRLPSAANGLTSIKPTWGRVSRYGVFPMADSFDHVGPMARNAIDVGIMLNAIAGADRNDPTASGSPVPDYTANCSRNIRGLKIGLPANYVKSGSSAEIVDAWMATAKVFEGLGASLATIEYPNCDQAITDWSTIAAAETALSHKANYPAQQHQYGPVLAAFLDVGQHVSGIDLAAASIRRIAFNEQVNALFQNVQLFLVPVLGGCVPTTNEWLSLAGADFAPYLQYTIPADMTGGPTMTFPVGFDRNGLPIVMQLCGPHFSEALLCQVVAEFQRLTDWHTHHPED